MKQHWTAEGGLNIFYMTISQGMRQKMCDIRLSQLVLSKIVELLCISSFVNLVTIALTVFKLHGERVPKPPPPVREV